jgi:hypothetical protein
LALLSTGASPFLFSAETHRRKLDMTSHTTPVPPDEQRQNLLDAERKAHLKQPRSFKDDALTDKVVRVEPDGTGPTPTETFDPAQDQHAEPVSERAAHGKT